YSSPGKWKSAVYRAVPVTFRGPSTRGVPRPIGDAGVSCVGILVLQWNQAVVAICRACARQRLASSILNPFSLCGRASRIAASAAFRKLALLAGGPASAVSAAGDRQGLVAAPPRAMRARASSPPASVITTAADASANSYDARSRSFRYTCLLPATGGGSVTCV